jgi:hypothetical protein
MKTSYIRLACSSTDVLLKQQVLQMRSFRDKESNLLLLFSDDNDNPIKVAADCPTPPPPTAVTTHW